MPAKVRSKTRPSADAERAKMLAQVSDPQIGALRRRQLQRMLDPRLRDGRAIGPSAPPEPPQPPMRAAQIRGIRSMNEVSRAHRQAVEREIKVIDERIKQINQRFAASKPGIVSNESQEAAAERRHLRELRRELESEIDKPIMVNRDGRELTDRDHAIVRARGRELAKSYWVNAERAQAEGDHRRARQLRRDALRSRQIAEMEAGWRTSLAGFGISAWA